MSNDSSNGDFKLKVSEWRGYVLRALEDIDSDIKTFDKKLNVLDKRTVQCKEDRKEEIRQMVETVEENLLTYIKTFEEKVNNEKKIIEKKVNKLYLKITAIGISVGIISGIIFGIFQKLVVKALSGG